MQGTKGVFSPTTREIDMEKLRESQSGTQSKINAALVDYLLKNNYTCPKCSHTFTKSELEIYVNKSTQKCPKCSHYFD